MTAAKPGFYSSPPSLDHILFYLLLICLILVVEAAWKSDFPWKSRMGRYSDPLEYDRRENVGGENDDSHDAGQRNQLDSTRQHKVSIHQPATQQTSGPELPSCTAAGCSPVKENQPGQVKYNSTA